jgi:hypothetical protein
MSLSALCKVCLYYNHGDKTCVRSIVAVSPGKIHHDYAKFVRLNKHQCGPQGDWFVEILGKDGLSKKTALDELFESFDI